MFESWPVVAFGLMAVVLIIHASIQKAREVLKRKTNQYHLMIGLVFLLFASGLFYDGLIVRHSNGCLPASNGLDIICSSVNREFVRFSEFLELDKKTVRRCGCMFRIENKKTQK